jgi:hypothetical protein
MDSVCSTRRINGSTEDRRTTFRSAAALSKTFRRWINSSGIVLTVSHRRHKLLIVRHLTLQIPVVTICTT